MWLFFLDVTCTAVSQEVPMWKDSLVCAVPQCSKPWLPQDYQQISLLICVGKVFEGILKNRLLQETETAILASQHGFMKNKATVSALLHILQTWHNAVDENPKHDVHVTFIDFTRAFDTINHGHLRHSLKMLGVSINI